MAATASQAAWSGARGSHAPPASALAWSIDASWRRPTATRKADVGRTRGSALGAKTRTATWRAAKITTRLKNPAVAAEPTCIQPIA